MLEHSKSSSSYRPKVAVKFATILDAMRGPSAIPVEDCACGLYLNPPGMTAHCRYSASDQIFLARLRVLNGLTALLTASQSRVRDPPKNPASLEYQMRTSLEACDQLIPSSGTPLMTINKRRTTTCMNVIPDLAWREQEQVRGRPTIALGSRQCGRGTFYEAQ